ncbi:endo alpha-1,4 polygalactosaminidase [Cellulomonas sp. SLBN-39]|uniref:endo alpha-1,4 polygalactosaminidase n=1 Tax=Cellulomonas sp. SLBN-39 TaxID=2768446 RepID=UPI00114E4039|nr:endo alpha-1,4 polygalactosaminidase [Cellulomonas sp. SLBN-39]TQL02145.1 hypothetical protein FBY24_1214 [Cellulomonas sp. SLBN-39]
MTPHPAPHRARPAGRVPLRRALVGLVALLAAAGCSGTPTGSGTVAEPPAAPATASPATSVAPSATTSAAATGEASPVADAAPPVALPPSGAVFEYQLGGADEPADGTEVVIRDSTEPPSGGYDICYVNGFQTQPGDTEQTIRDEPDLVLHVDGEPLRDPGWPDEVIFDVSTPALRERVAARVGATIDGCAAAGFDAVEIDNLDAYTRSAGLLDEDDALATAALLIDRAHAAGLAFAQKNTAELTEQVRALGADLVVAEECAAWEECGVFTSAYPVVLDVEYDADAFAAACAAQTDPGTHDPHLSVILRDYDVSPRSAPDAVHETC